MTASASVEDACTASNLNPRKLSDTRGATAFLALADLLAFGLLGVAIHAVTTLCQKGGATGSGKEHHNRQATNRQRSPALPVLVRAGSWDWITA